MLIPLIGFTPISMAQTADNALLFSQQNYGSTARSKAMGNAFGALGGDFGSLSINPAGIGIFQRSEISTTLSLLNLNTTESTYQGNSAKDDQNRMNIQNFGYATMVPIHKPFSGLISFNFGIGCNRLANFNQNTSMSIESSPYSRMDAFVQNTNGINYYNLINSEENNPYTGSVPWESILAWENYLIDVTNSDTDGNQYTTFLLENEKVKQRETANHEGYINEYLTAFGLNFNHRLYLGASLGVQNLYYNETKTYAEIGMDEIGTNLKSWGQYTYTNSSSTSGLGFNFKIGAIYRPIPTLRIGIAIHTPTLFKIKKIFRSEMNSTLTGIGVEADGSHEEKSPTGKDVYHFHTPFRAIGSIAYQIDRKGILSADLELADYSSSKYSNGLGGDNFGTENGEIKNTFKAVANIRIGGEYKLTEAVSLRGGLELMGNPYQPYAFGISQPNMNFHFRTYNGGYGYRSGRYSFDLTYGLGDKTNFMYPYLIDGVDVDPVKYHTYTHEILFTFGMRI